jgi:hypothetical protein
MIFQPIRVKLVRWHVIAKQPQLEQLANQPSQLSSRVCVKPPADRFELARDALHGAVGRAQLPDDLEETFCWVSSVKAYEPSLGGF